MGQEREPDIGSVLEVEISSDGLTARARWKPGAPPEERARWSSADVESFLVKSGIHFGVAEEGLERLLAVRADDGASWVEVARGIPPEPGQPGGIEWLTQDSKAEGAQGEPRDPGSGANRVDLRDRGGIPSVSPGTPLIRLVPPIPGKNGTSVRGVSIPAPTPGAIAVVLGPGVQWNEDHTTVLARVAGHPVYNPRRRRIDVQPMYQVQGDVDYGVGHVSFEGSLHIGGSVQPGFRVKASGDVVIDGAVDGGIIESGGDVKVGAGIYGGTRGSVRAGGSVQAKFIQQGRVSAEFDVVAQRSILHSETSAGRDIEVLSPAGTIAGGTCTAVHRIRAAVLGSPMAVPTTVAVGLPQTVRDRWRNVQQDLRRMDGQRSKLRLAIQVLEKRLQVRQDPGTLGMKQKLQRDLAELDERIQEGRLELQMIAEDMRQFQDAAVTAHKVYPGVKIIIGNAVYAVIQEMDRVRFTLDGGEIRVSPEG
ncbi:MAG: DUF342 domain-containing protein [Kyrpidia tusciae]|nr:FapA family protein [Kyrpidia tusciae]MBE3553061.1 DUF342 domain-containing protein [Kyrpidia tusciae]